MRSVDHDGLVFEPGNLRTSATQTIPGNHDFRKKIDKGSREKKKGRGSEKNILVSRPNSRVSNTTEILPFVRCEKKENLQRSCRRSQISLRKGGDRNGVY